MFGTFYFYFKQQKNIRLYQLYGIEPNRKIPQTTSAAEHEFFHTSVFTMCMLVILITHGKLNTRADKFSFTIVL